MHRSFVLVSAGINEGLTTILVIWSMCVVGKYQLNPQVITQWEQFMFLPLRCTHHAKYPSIGLHECHPVTPIDMASYLFNQSLLVGDNSLLTPTCLGIIVKLSCNLFYLHYCFRPPNKQSVKKKHILSSHSISYAIGIYIHVNG